MMASSVLSVVVSSMKSIARELTQYRVFFSKDGQAQTLTEGVICVLKGQSSGGMGYEFSTLKGIKPATTDSTLVSGNVICIHGGFDGYVYRQEQGNDFDGTAINGKYRSSDLTMQDPGIRKHMQRVIVNFKPDAAIDADLFVRYDYESKKPKIKTRLIKKINKLELIFFRFDNNWQEIKKKIFKNHSLIY